jgi:leucyl/phenylalanyl-tRNA--protein transferase
MHILSSTIWFPPIEDALEDGLLAIGGDLSPERLILAYRKGIFPWYEGETPLWWSPDPRFVLFPEHLVISKSMHQVIKKKLFEFKTNTAFAEVIKQCKNQPRMGQDGTWITDAVEFAYNELHHNGIAHSAEAWQNNQLVGGLYGIKMGKLFFGESMFSKVSNASKFAFIELVNQLKLEGIVLIDCQVYTTHLESLGANMISRTDFKKYLAKYC